MTTPADPSFTSAPSPRGIPPARDATVSALAAVDFFANLPDAALQTLAANCRRRVLEADTALFREGDDPGSLYIVLRGQVHIRAVTAAGKSVHLAERGPGEPIGELALLDGEPRMADAVTATDCELLVLRRDAFTQCIERHPVIAIGVMRTLAQRLREAGRRLTIQEEQDVSGRLARLLLETVSSGGGVKLAGGETRLTTTRTQQQMAEQIGAARESVTRALADMKQRKILRSEGRTLIVIDLLKLKRQAERI